MLTSSYDPTSLTVAKGQAVRFINESGLEHTVTFTGTRPPGVSDVGLNSSGTFSRTFNDAGTFTFHCTQHSGMNGQITVN
jgi:plastocyanin